MFLVLTILVLFGLSSAQAFLVYKLTRELDQTRAQARADRVAASAEVEAVASRVAELERAAFRPDRIAEAALPSVFRVKAGQASGTAWAVGKPRADGGANMFTNFHVVETFWNTGGRSVSLEHRQQLYKATIVKVDKDLDVAHLETDGKFPGLTISPTEVRPGQPIVVVGAALGLDNSVTTGVVSNATRRLEGDSNTYVQFDAPINPGNSGGPVINAQGQVVGIASAKIRNAEGFGLAIPIADACRLFPICT